MTGPEQVLVEDWCQQYPSHSIGTVEFGRDGALYASGGDGASFNFADWGQDGNPLNPCGDPPGGSQAPPSPRRQPRAGRYGARICGLLEIRSAWTAASSGSIRPPAPAFPTTRWSATTDPNARRIIAHGIRNPFRFTTRPGTDELWIGDVGWNDGKRSTGPRPSGRRGGELRLAVL